jgi:hypothetical protein
MIIQKTCTPSSMFSGERFNVTYRIYGSEKDARAKAEDICIEQTVEFPAECVGEGAIRDHVFGRIESFELYDKASFRAVISYAVEIAAGELTQLLNVIFGNTSIKPGIRVEHLDLPSSLLNTFKGPRFGRDGIRKLLNVPFRPLLSTAIKPMGHSSEELADLAYRFAKGGRTIKEPATTSAPDMGMPRPQGGQRRASFYCSLFPHKMIAGHFAKAAGAGGAGRAGHHRVRSYARACRR